MTKIIEFKHRGENIRSVAIINHEPSECSVLVMPYVCKDELGNAIVIKRKNQGWTSEEPIATSNQITYNNILNALDPLMMQ